MSLRTDNASCAQPLDVPPLSQLYLYLTDGCNLACRHCWISPLNDPRGETSTFLSVGLIERAIDEALPLGLESLKLTGGEPLLHPGVVAIVLLAHRYGLRVMLETNGTLLTSAVVGALASADDAFVSVSVDSADREAHDWLRGTPEAFAQAIEGIRMLVAAGLRPQMIMTLTRRTLGDVGPLVQLAQTLGAGSVKFNVIQPTGRAEGMPGSDVPTPEELIALGRWVDLELAGEVSIDLHFDYPLAFRPLSSIPRRGFGLCGIKESLGIIADGHYALCGIGEHVPELTFGRVGAVALADIWESEPELLGLRQGMPKRLKGVCGRCIHRQMCAGACVAQTWYRTGEFWAPFWFCEAAERAGLFPESRLEPM